MIDYTADEQGRLCAAATALRGRSASTGRSSVAAERRAATRGGELSELRAALKINMAGVCEYCRSKIVGEFDWVLSRIEQDEAYMG
jgi:hypothetical protein